MMTKDMVQAQARHSFELNNYWGLIAAATGVGKSKMGVDEAAATVLEKPDALIVIVVPTKKLRDNNWQDEFIQWKQLDIYNANVQRFCYVSVNKLAGKVIDLLILDEGHNITPNNAEVFSQNKIHKCMVLTATPPKPINDTYKEKIQLLERLKLKTIFEYPLDQAVNDGLVAPYEIRIVECRLDDKQKYIKAGSKAKPFYQTEKQRYDYLTKLVRTLQFKQSDAAQWKILERMRFIKTLKSKTEIARRIIQKHIEDGERYIIFCGSIERANDLCGPAVYHSKVSDAALTAFINQELDVLGVVDALNEGINVPNVNGAVVAQIASNEKDITQQIGRTIRLRANHKSIIWICVVMDTIDEDWMKKALKEFDPSRITYYHYKNVI